MNYFLNLSCDKSIQGNNAIFYVITMTSFFIFISSFISDIFGRKVMFMISPFLQIFGAVFALAKLDYNFIVFGVALQTLCKLF